MTHSAGGPPPFRATARFDPLEAAIIRAGRRGWRADAVAPTYATLTRPWVWMPTWAHLMLMLPTCLLWAIAWAWMRSPKRARATRYLVTDRHGRVIMSRVPHAGS